MNTYSFASLLSTQFVLRIQNAFEPVLPETVGDFHLEGELKKQGYFKHFLLGIYRNKKYKAFAKVWNQDDPFFLASITNEANMYRLLGRVVGRIAHLVPDQIKHIAIPKFYKFVCSGGKAMLLIEFVDGKPLANYSNLQKRKIYNQVVDYTRFLGENMFPAEKRQVGKRSALNEICIFPFVLARATISYPGHISLFVRSAVEFVKLIPSLFTKQNLVLTHRDLHPKNILVGKGKVYVIDLENMVFTLPEYEYVISLINVWRDKAFVVFLI